VVKWCPDPYMCSNLKIAGFFVKLEGNNTANECSE